MSARRHHAMSVPGVVLVAVVAVLLYAGALVVVIGGMR